ncbi:polysaccharide deacetylase family protein, partial [Dehalococcoidia bacterium]|nr:polysaccharide deacetylase family protein [Dehalococcoidia bacterium]
MQLYMPKGGRIMKKLIRPTLIAIACCIALLALLTGPVAEPGVRFIPGEGTFTIGEGRLVFTIGHAAHAAAADFVADGVDDHIQFQQALDALPIGGGKLIVLAGTYNFGAAVGRAIDNVTIQGVGQATVINRDGINPVFTAGAQSNWVFRDFKTDAGGIELTAAKNYTLQNITIGTSYVAFRTDAAAEAWDIPVGRTATIVVAASDSSPQSKAQADFVADGVDDQVEIQAAIDALPASGGRVVLLEGTYIKGNIHPITIPCNVEIELIGGATITFKPNVGDGAIIFANADTWRGNSNITIRGGVLDGNRANQAVGTQSGIKFTRVSYSSVDSLIRNFSDRNIWKVGPSIGNEFRNRSFPNVLNVGNVESVVSSHPLMRLLDDFETDWIYTTPTVSYDTTHKRSGTRSVKVTTPVGGSTFLCLPISGLDLSKSAFYIWAYIEDHTKLTTICFAVRSGGTWDNYGVYGHLHPGMSRRWVRLVAPYFDRIVGNPDFQNPDMIRLGVHARPNEVVTIWFDELSYAKKVLTEGGLVTFCFDDGCISAYTKAKPIFDRHGVGAVWAQVTKWGDKWGRFPAEAKRMQESGWDIVPHSRLHINAPDAHSWWEEEILGSQSDLVEAGFKRGARFYILPGGFYNEKIAEVLEGHFLFVRTTGREGIPLPPGTIQGALSVTAAHSVADLKEKLDIAKRENLWLQLVFHDIVDSGATG